MNVALTRAKSSLFVIGNAATLERSDAKWRTIIGDARDRGLLIDYARNTFSGNVPHPKPIMPPARKDSGPANGASANGASKPQPTQGVKRKPTSEPNDRPPKTIKRESSPMPSSSAMRSSSPAPPPPTSTPPPLPPPTGPSGLPRPVPTNTKPGPPPNAGGAGAGPSRAPPPPKPASRAAEDVLFMKKKKKPNRPATGPPVGNVRAAINNHLARK